MIDKRVIERQIRKGKLDAAAYRRTLEALPDVSDRVARDTDEPSRSVAAAPASAQDRAPEGLSDADDDLDDEQDDDEPAEEPGSTTASY